MQERNRPTTGIGQLPGPAGLGDVFEPGSGGIELARVAHGVYVEQLPVVGMSVADVRARFAGRLDIDPETQAILDGSPADESTVIRTGQMLTFIRAAGEKGLRRTA